jgi:hypothetical protein
MTLLIKVYYEDQKGIIKGRTVSKEEDYFFLKDDFCDDSEEAFKSIPKLVKFLVKNGGNMHIKSINEFGIQKTHLFVNADKFGRGIVKIGTFINGDINRYDWKSETEYAPESAVAKIMGVASSVFEESEEKS